MIWIAISAVVIALALALLSVTAAIRDAIEVRRTGKPFVFEAFMVGYFSVLALVAGLLMVVVIS